MKIKINVKLKAITFLMLAFIVFPSSISYGAETMSNPQINSRGLVFNTGRSSDQIRLMKDFFRASNYQNVPWGYGYDARTKELVREYQKSKGLGADGIAGQNTISAMNKDISDKKLDIGLRVPYTDVQGDLLIVNKSSNTIYFLKDGQVQESYPAATGKTVELTPDGQFKIVIKFKNPSWGGAGVSDPIAGGAPNNPLGKRWIGISYKGGRKYGVHGNSSPTSIGTSASLGCVRMFNEDVEKLYDKVKINTPIWMGPEDVLEGYGIKFKYNTSSWPKDPVPVVPVVPEKPQAKPVNINIILNGVKMNLDNPVMNKEGSTYYPFREILEFVGAGVVWDDVNKKVTGSLNGKFVQFRLDSDQYADGEGVKSLGKGKEVFAMKGKTYVPIRNLMESLGFNVIWDPASETVTLTK